MQAKAVLPFFGSEIKNRFTQLRLRSLAEDYILLPLNIEAIDYVVSAGVDYTLIDDWLKAVTFSDAYQQAQLLEKSWFKPAQENLTARDICWPAFDYRAMQKFWHSFTLAFALAEVIKSQGLRLSFIPPLEKRAFVKFGQPDIYPYIWKTVLGDSAETLKLTKSSTDLIKPLKKICRKIISLPKNTFEKIENLMLQPNRCPDFKEKIVVAVDFFELFRFIPLIRELEKRYPGEIVLVPSWYKPEVIEEIRALNVQSAFLPFVKNIRSDNNISHKFKIGIREAIAAIGSFAQREALAALDFHFAYYAEKRWPQLIFLLDLWTNLWKAGHPRIVIASTLFTSEAQLPVEAARRCGIPTLALPHALVCEPEGPIASEYICYNYSCQKLMFLHEGFCANNLMPCKGILTEDEYKSRPANLFPSINPWKILVLTNNIGFGASIGMMLARPRAQLDAIKTVGSIPKEILPKVSLYIKTHPHWPDIELFKATGRDLTAKVLPPDTELGPLLSRVDLVVALNYYGSALIHVLRKEKPVVFFWTDRGSEWLNFSKFFLAAGPCVETAEEFWILVERFFTDSVTANKMCSQVQEFHQNYLDDRTYPGIQEVISDILDKSIKIQREE
jgi:hypothetical protein